MVIRYYERQCLERAECGVQSWGILEYTFPFRLTLISIHDAWKHGTWRDNSLNLSVFWRMYLPRYVTDTVNVNITSPITAYPRSDSYVTSSNNVLTVPLESGVLANDRSLETSPLWTVQLVGTPASGNVELAAGGSFIYTPRSNFVGNDTFTYAAHDGVSTSAMTQVNILVDPAVDLSWVKGLDYRYCRGSFSTTSKLFSAQPAKTGTVTFFDLSPRDQEDRFGFIFTGFIDLLTAGDWTFYLKSDEGAQLWIDDILMIDNDGPLWSATAERSGVRTIELGAEGKNTIRVAYIEKTGVQSLSVGYAGPGIIKSMPIKSGSVIL